MTTAFKDMPDDLPVFPLTGVLLLPAGTLPLNVFEPRYIAMIDDALATPHRLIGMIQPRDNAEPPALFETGCAGRITGYEETEDGRYLVTLSGLCRFRVADELPERKGYRRVKPDWSAFEKDFQPKDCLDLDRDKLKETLKAYFGQQDLSCDWAAIDGVSDGKLITCLSMICPFDATEKQMLLEAPCCRTRAERFIAMLDMAVRGGKDCGGCH